MPWCPKCKNEYREGIDICADCGSELIDSQEEQDSTTLIFGEEEQEKKDVDSPTNSPYKGVYQDSAVRAEENRSSAWTLLLVGGVGLVVMILGIIGILPFQLTGTNKYMVYGIMSALFMLFIVMGIISMKNSLVFTKKAQSENSLRMTMLNWCKESLNAEVIDRTISLTGEETDEVLYFRRAEKMKEELNHKFVNLDQEFLEHFIDDEYDTLFSTTK